MPSRGNSMSKGSVARGNLLLGQREPGMAGRERTQKKVDWTGHNGPSGILRRFLFIPRVIGSP